MTRVLIKVFAWGFYRTHSGLLISMFGIFFIYFFFTPALNQTHLSADEIILHNLRIVLTIASDPVILPIIFILWFIYVYKSWNYVTNQLRLAQNEFLFYSSNAAPKISQLKCWFIVQLVISLPILLYTLFIITLGAIFKHHMIPAIILCYTLVIVALNSWSNVLHANSFQKVASKQGVSFIGLKGKKNVFNFFLYHALTKLKIEILVTKILSLGLMFGGLYLLSDIDQSSLKAGIIGLGIILSHTLIGYQSYKFEKEYCSFVLNLPYSRNSIYLQFGLSSGILLLPESLFLFFFFEPFIALTTCIFCISIFVLIRSMFYIIGLDMRKYLYVILIASTPVYFLTVGGFMEVLILLATLTSSWIVKHYYFRQKPAIVL